MIKLSLRKTRSVALFLCGMLALSVTFSPEGFAMLLGIAFIISAALTALFLFIHFDRDINQKVLMEAIVDGFAGLILFTYPQAIHGFLYIDFSFWTFFMGVLYLASGLLDKTNKQYLWLYSLAGIVMIVLGFVMMNYDPEQLNSAYYLAIFVLIMYSVANFFLMIRRKADIY